VLGFEQDILGLDVTMNYIVLVSEVECISNFTGDLEGIINRKLLLTAQTIPERLTFVLPSPTTAVCEDDSDSR
jgi:tRNA A37 threonylcarbamoyladenosine synthetase subunit TsaC/SUA5/YrdC